MNQVFTKIEPGLLSTLDELRRREPIFHDAAFGYVDGDRISKRARNIPQGLKCLRENPVLNARERSRGHIRLRRKPVQLKKQQVSAALRRSRSASQR